MFIAICLASILPVLAVGIAGTVHSYPLLLVFGFFLGIAGTVFAVGIPPFANSWYEPARRGFATGVFGAGMVGTALSAFFTPPVRRLVRPVDHARRDRRRAGGDRARLRAGDAQLADVHPPEHRSGAAQTEGGRKARGDVGDVLSLRGRLRRLRRVQQLPADLYQDGLRILAGGCGGGRTAAFALAAVVARPIGGALSDRIPPKFVVLVSLAGGPR